MGGGLGLFIAEVITVLDEFALGRKHGADFSGEIVGNMGRKIQKREAGENHADVVRMARMALEEFVELEGVAGDDFGAGETGAQQIGHLGRLFDGDEAVLGQAVFKEGFGDGASAGAEFESVGVGVGGQPAGHGDGELF